MEENKVRKVLAKILNDADSDSYYTGAWHDCVALRIIQSPDLRVTIVEPPSDEALADKFLLNHYDGDSDFNSHDACEFAAAYYQWRLKKGSQ